MQKLRCDDRGETMMYFKCETKNYYLISGKVPPFAGRRKQKQVTT